MADENSGRMADRVAKLEADQKKIAEALKRAGKEIESEWGEEIVEPGTEIAGVKF